MFDGSHGGEYSGIDFVKVSKIFARPNAFPFGTEPFQNLCNKTTVPLPTIMFGKRELWFAFKIDSWGTF